MVSTVTTSTVMTVTTVAVASSLVLIVVLTMFTLLVQKEIATTARERWARALERVLNVGLIPLLLAFLALVVLRIAELLR
jgi:Mg2+/Co2+ transporter CorB